MIHDFTTTIFFRICKRNKQTLCIDNFYHILIANHSKCTTVLKTFNLYNNTHKRFPPTLFFLHNMTSLLGKDAEGESID